MSATPPKARATFRKHERLTGRDRIGQVMKNGKSMSDAPLRLVGLVLTMDTVSPAQVAFAVPKRHVRHATDRNRTRRLLREAWRLDKELWYGPLRAAGVQCAWLCVCSSSDLPDLMELRSKLRSLMERWLKQHLPA